MLSVAETFGWSLEDIKNTSMSDMKQVRRYLDDKHKEQKRMDRKAKRRK